MTDFSSAIAAQEAVRSWGFWILVIGVAGEFAVLAVPKTHETLERVIAAICIALIVFGIALEQGADGKISDLTSQWQMASNQKTAELNDEAAKLETRAANLTSDNLALEKLMIPRRLLTAGLSNDRRQEEADEKFRALAKWKQDNWKFPMLLNVDIQVVPDFESQTLALDLARTLWGAGWNPGEASENESHVSPLSIFDGVAVIFVPMRANASISAPLAESINSQLVAAGNALCAALTDAGLTDELGRSLRLHGPDDVGVPGVPPRPQFNPPRMGLFIEVGMKPVTHQLRELQSGRTGAP